MGVGAKTWLNFARYMVTAIIIALVVSSLGDAEFSDVFIASSIGVIAMAVARLEASV